MSAAHSSRLATRLGRRCVPMLALVLSVAAGLYMALTMYMVGEPILAITMLVVTALGAWAYGSPRTQAMRYLLPGVVSAAVFVVMPMVYTISIGFTNHSSKNLLSFERAKAYLLDETYAKEAGTFRMDLVARGNAWVVRAQSEDDAGAIYWTDVLKLDGSDPTRPDLRIGPASDEPAATLKDVIARQAALKALHFQLQASGAVLRMNSLRSLAPVEPLYEQMANGSLKNRQSGQVLSPNNATGFFETQAGEQVQPGYKVNVGLAHFKRIFTDSKFREPFVEIFVWTVVFSALSVLFCAALGIVLAVLLSWENLGFRGVYRLLLFLPYAVPGFISILIFKGLFNQNLGEINLILNALFGVKPHWVSDPVLAKVMLLIVNTWLGFPYMMIVSMGLIKSIPSDLYEASAVAGAGPLSNFFSITLPLIITPLVPLLISSFAFNFNNFVLITLLTGGRPDFIDTSVPAGETDILVSYTFRIAFEDSGQQFGLAAAIATVIFLLVASITVLQMRLTRMSEQEKR